MRSGQQGGSAAIAGASFGLVGRLRLSFGDPRALFRDALEREIAERRPFLWLPAAAGAGVVLYLCADNEPVLWLPGLAFVAFAGLVWLTRQKRGAFALFVALAAVSAGFVSAGWKSARVAGPVLERIRVTTVTGFIEQMDYRRQGACFVMRLASAEGLSPEQMPRRIRLTDRYRPPAEAGAFVKLKARLLPPATRISPSSAPSAICGAITLKVQDDRFEMRTARAVGENRPWSRAPRAFGRASANTAQRGDTREEDLRVSDRLD